MATANRSCNTSEPGSNLRLLEINGMMIEFETVGRVMYVTLLDKKAVKTVELSSRTLIDLSKSGELIGVEILSPNRSDLRRLAIKYRQPELSRIDPGKLFHTGLSSRGLPRT